MSNLKIQLSIIFAAGLSACSGVGGSTAGPFDNGSSGLACPDSPATDLFQNTVCVCEDLNDIGNLVVGRAIATDDAVLAVNGHTNFINNADIRGSLRSVRRTGSERQLDYQGHPVLSRRRSGPWQR